MAETDSNVRSTAAQPQPGQVVAPGGAPAPNPVAAPSSVPASPQSAVPAQQQPTQIAPAAVQPSVITATETAPTPPTPAGPAAQATGDKISWTASEFVAHEKGAGWYFILAGIAIVVAALVFLIAHDIISVVVILVAAFAFGMLGSRKPRQQQYGLSAGGLDIGQRHYGYDEFRSFSVAHEGAFSSIVLMPLKRFAPLMTIYYAPEDEDKIVDLISVNLPFEDRKPDPIDNLMSRVRF